MSLAREHSQCSATGFTHLKQERPCCSPRCPHLVWLLGRWAGWRGACPVKSGEFGQAWEEESFLWCLLTSNHILLHCLNCPWLALGLGLEVTRGHCGFSNPQPLVNVRALYLVIYCIQALQALMLLPTLRYDNEYSGTSESHSISTVPYFLISGESIHSRPCFLRKVVGGPR